MKESKKMESVKSMSFQGLDLSTIKQEARAARPSRFVCRSFVDGGNGDNLQVALNQARAAGAPLVIRLADMLRAADRAAARDPFEAARADAAGLLSASDRLLLLAPPPALTAAERDAERAEVAGLLSAADYLHCMQAAVAAEVTADNEAAKLRGLLSGAEVVRIRAVARLHRLADSGGAGVSYGEDGALVVAPSIGAAAMVATACGAVGHGDTGTRADIVNATAAAARGIGEGWHAAQAAAAQAKLRGLLAAETIAAAASLFRCGLLGRASARGARIAAAMARRWLRLNSRREALTGAEVGGAAGVDDRQAARDWSAELSSIAAAIFAAAAANGSALLALAAAARSGGGAAECSAEVAALAALSPLAARSALFGRGERSAAPLVIWTAAGRSVAEESFGLVGRGSAWLAAATLASRAMHSARYGMGGRDGREVPACWSISGSLSEAAAADMWHCQPTRRPLLCQAARNSLCDDILRARVEVVHARVALDRARDKEERLYFGQKLGDKLNVLRSAKNRARAIGRAWRGESIAGTIAAAWIDDKGNMTPSGRKAAQRIRANFRHAEYWLAMERGDYAAASAARAATRAAILAMQAGVLAGDEVAEHDNIAPSSLCQSINPAMSTALA